MEVVSQLKNVCGAAISPLKDTYEALSYIANSLLAPELFTATKGFYANRDKLYTLSLVYGMIGGYDIRCGYIKFGSRCNVTWDSIAGVFTYRVGCYCIERCSALLPLNFGTIRGGRGSTLKTKGNALGDSGILFYICLGCARILGNCAFVARVSYRLFTLRCTD